MIFFREGGNPERYSWKGRVPGGGGGGLPNKYDSYQYRYGPCNFTPLRVTSQSYIKTGGGKLCI